MVLTLHEHHQHHGHGHGYGHGDHDDVDVRIRADARRFVRLPTNRIRGPEDSRSEHFFRLLAAWGVIATAELGHLLLERFGTRALHSGVGVLAQATAERASALDVWKRVGKRTDAGLDVAGRLIRYDRIKRYVERRPRLQAVLRQVNSRSRVHARNTAAKTRWILQRPVGKFASGLVGSTIGVLLAAPLFGTAVVLGQALFVGVYFGLVKANLRAIGVHHLPNFGLEHDHAPLKVKLRRAFAKGFNATLGRVTKKSLSVLEVPHNCTEVEPVRRDNPFDVADPLFRRELTTREAMFKAEERLGALPPKGDPDRDHAHFWYKLAAIYITARGNTEQTWACREDAARGEADALIGAYKAMPHRKHHFAKCKPAETELVAKYMTHLKAEEANARMRIVEKVVMTPQQPRAFRPGHQPVLRLSVESATDLLSQHFPQARHRQEAQRELVEALVGARLVEDGERVRLIQPTARRFAEILTRHGIARSETSLNMFDRTTRSVIGRDDGLSQSLALV